MLQASVSVTAKLERQVLSLLRVLEKPRNQTSRLPLFEVVSVGDSCRQPSLHGKLIMITIDAVLSVQNMQVNANSTRAVKR